MHRADLKMFSFLAHLYDQEKELMEFGKDEVRVMVNALAACQ